MSSTDLDHRRKRLYWRAHHRGMRELDVLIGQFAEQRLASMSEAEMEQFEALLEVPDPDMLGWVTDAFPVPEEYDTPLYRALKTSQAKG